MKVARTLPLFVLVTSLTSAACSSLTAPQEILISAEPAQAPAPAQPPPVGAVPGGVPAGDPAKMRPQAAQSGG